MVLRLGLEVGQQGWKIGYTVKNGTSIAAPHVAGGEQVEVGSQTSAGILKQFSFQVGPGTIKLAAWADESEDGEICHGDYVGMELAADDL